MPGRFTVFVARCTCIAAFLAGAASLSAADPPADEVSQVAARIDELIARRWNEAGVRPADDAADDAFLRRASLDLTGVIPTVGEVHEFLDDASPDKRDKLVDRLLARPRHATHLARVWRDALLPRSGEFQQQFLAARFELWLRDRLVDRVPFDKVVRELLTTTGQVNQNGAVAYFTALELKPDELAASTSRVFLGVQIQCAECHQHPFDHWSQHDFWGFAAFFARTQRPPRPQPFEFQVADSDAGEVSFPNSDVPVAPRFLDGASPAEEKNVTRRQHLADWLTSRDNPYFARAVVNRGWALLFGRGLVHPVDDFGKHNPPSHPEVLEILAEDFASHGYDLRRLLSVLCRTRAYRLSSETPPSFEPTREPLFERMAVKTLSAEQIYDCIAQAALKRGYGSALDRQFDGSQNDSEKRAFLARFDAPSQGATEFQAGIPQALTLMNGSLTDAATNLAQSDLLAAVSQSPFFDDEQRVEVLFLATLSRYPRTAERSRFVEHIHTSTAEKWQALGDVLWALLNSGEFLMNH